MFSRQQAEPKILNLNSIVADMAKMLPRLVGEHIELVTCLARDLSSCADQGQIEQVIMNLAVNAPGCHAPGRKVDDRNSEQVEFDERQVMDAETQTRIFEPFFTTKEQEGHRAWPGNRVWRRQAEWRFSAGP